MGKLIPFPRSKKEIHRTVEDMLVEKLPEHEQHPGMSNARFTCASCGNVATLDFTGVVFRDCRFYCSSCGTGYKLDNPLFSKKPRQDIK